VPCYICRMPPASLDPLAPLRSGPPSPLYCIYGKERFLIDRAVELLRGRVLEPATRDFNYELFYGKEATAGRIVQAARTLPMMAKRRFILVRDADAMKADELNGLIGYVSAPCEESCLVLVAEKIDQRIKLFTTWKKKGVLLKLDPLYERQLPAFVREEARQREVRFDAGAAELLCEEVGAELGQLADAVERLSIYVGERKTIALEDVESQVATTRQRTVFELADAVGQGSRERALVALGSLLSAKESGVRIVAMLARHLRQLWRAHQLLGERADKMTIASELGMPPFFVDGIIEQARRADASAFPRMHQALFEADRALKSSRLEDERLLERLILQLTQMKSVKSPRQVRAR
jgi:DNA polymerase-3 subunit delta